MILFTIYGIIQFLQGKIYYAHVPPVPISGLYYVNKIHFSLLPIFVFYDYSRKGIITEVFMRKYLIVFFIVITIGAIFHMFEVQEQMGNDEVTNNFGYTYLSFIPMLLYLPPKSKKQIFLWSISLVMILLCMKRGAIIISLIVTSIYCLYLFRKSSGFAKRRLVFGFILFILLGLFIINKLASSSDYFNERIERTIDGDSSGRDTYYLFFVDYYLNQTTQQDFLFGMGANATLGIWDNYAHNDWLEIAINQGLLGIIIYIYFWICFFITCKGNSMVPHIKVVLWMIFVIYFMQTLFSMSYREYTLYSSMALGFSLAMINMRRSKSIR